MSNLHRNGTPGPFDTLKDELVEFAWPGGYQVFYMDGEGTTLCAKCARKSEEIFRNGVLGDFAAWCANVNGDDGGVGGFLNPDTSASYANNWSWEEKLRPAAQGVNYEDSNLQCGECMEMIPASCGE